MHELLRHLETLEFDGAPRFLGVDTSDRDVLSYLSGDVPPELGDFSDAQLVAAACLLRKLHDATLDCRWRDTHEVVCHGDASPCNCVFVDGMPTAFIDFDSAHAGSRLDDLGYAAWLWIDLGNDDRSVDRQGQRLADFFLGYGLETAGAIPSIIASQLALAARTESAGVRAWPTRVVCGSRAAVTSSQPRSQRVLTTPLQPTSGARPANRALGIRRRRARNRSLKYSRASDCPCQNIAGAG